MSYNAILQKKVIGTLVKNGKQVVISAATKTTQWERTDGMAEAAGTRFKALLEGNPDKVSEGTAELCLRETEHTSPADNKNHFTAVRYDANGQAKTEHVST